MGTPLRLAFRPRPLSRLPKGVGAEGCRPRGVTWVSPPFLAVATSSDGWVQRPRLLASLGPAPRGSLTPHRHWSPRPSERPAGPCSLRLGPECPSERRTQSDALWLASGAAVRPRAGCGPAWLVFPFCCPPSLWHGHHRVTLFLSFLPSATICQCSLLSAGESPLPATHDRLCAPCKVSTAPDKARSPSADPARPGLSA